MPRGDKSKYSEKQKRQAEDIERSYEARGTSENEAKRRAWATVNKMWKGGQKSTGVTKPIDTGPAKKGGKLGGKATAGRSASQRRASAKKSATTRKAHKKTAIYSH